MCKLSYKAYVTRGIALFGAVVTVMIALAALAQTTGQLPRKSTVVPALDSAAPSGAGSGSYSSGGSLPTSIALGDLKGDGKVDVVVANWCAGGTADCGHGSVGVLLGNGDGTFQLETPILSGGRDTSAVVIGDFNGDGKLDVVALNSLCAGKGCNGGGSISVFLGNGDGTFQKAATYGLLGSEPKALAVGDFNRDGKLDLAVAECIGDAACDSIGILMGNGDGTFQPEVDYGAGPGDCANSVVAADFNGDGKLDLAFADACQGFLSILLGNGDGTFQPAVQYAHGTAPLALATGDFNGDGKIDLASTALYEQFGTEGGGFEALVFLGHGDGSFEVSAGYPTGGFANMSVAVGDFNQDGKLDLVVTNGCGIDQQPCKSDGTVAILLGNGDGSFQFPVNYDSEGMNKEIRVQRPEEPIAVGDLNGDGRGDLVVANQCADSTCTNGSITVLLGNGDGTFEGQVVGNFYETSTTLTSAPNPSNFGERVIFTATVASAGPNTPTGKVKFLGVGSATLSGGVATLSTSTFALGTQSITATYDGDAFNAKSESAATMQTVNQASVSMVLTSTPNPSGSGKSVKFTAKLTSNGGVPSGQPVTFSYNGATLGTANVNSEGVATFLTTTLPHGSDVVTAAYAGSVDYSSASASVTQVVN
jgi:hypothetical protein